MAIKLDMSKAYDRVEWTFLEYMIKSVGFPNNRCRVIMEYVQSAIFLILVNGRRIIFSDKKNGKTRLMEWDKNGTQWSISQELNICQ
ncbi:hypothetical protein ACH5RR_017659 [Cinchona calisaya]|uniref:Reverse transcriptase n=1 Tax=Cinchona calisaya TaxID=153742 RepID=A0ABD2ZMV2_9GENT